MSSEHKALVRDLKRQGFDVEVTGKGRLRVSRGDSTPVIVPARRAAGRTLKNCVAELRKIGFDR